MDPAPRQPSLRPSNQKEKAGRLPRRLRPAKREDTSFLPKTRDRTRPLQLRYHERKRARRLHLLSLLRAEVHLLQLRLGCVSARPGARAIWRLCAVRSPLANFPGGPRPCTWAEARPAAWIPQTSRGLLDARPWPALDGGHHRSRARQHHRPRRPRAWATRVSIASRLGVQSFVRERDLRAPDASTRPRSSAPKSLCCARPASANQYRSDRGPSRPDGSQLARIAGLGRAPRSGACLGLHAGSG